MFNNGYFINSTVWHPLVSRLYFSVLFFLQTFRAQRTAKNTDLKILGFLDIFEKQIPWEKIPVPGPLVPYFQAISASKPSDDAYGFVTPYIDSTYYPDKSEKLNPSGTQTAMQPNIPILLDMIHRYSNVQNPPNLTDPEYFHQGKEFTLLNLKIPSVWDNNICNSYLLNKG